MSPQLSQKMSYSFKSDIWSIGAIFYELLHNQTPFHSTQIEEIIQKLEVGDYHISKNVISKMTIESILFLDHCLQYDELNREHPADIAYHPFVKT